MCVFSRCIYIKHFSITALCSVFDRRYWLWYKTQSCVSGMVRKVYQRLKQFKVQFMVLQRKTDPSQVLLQCLQANKVGVCACFRLVLDDRKMDTVALLLIFPNC